MKKRVKACVADKNLAKDFNKAQEISSKMCELREEVINKAVAWSPRWGYNASFDLDRAISAYLRFKAKHFPEKKK